MSESFNLRKLVPAIVGEPILKLLGSTEHTAFAAIAANQPFPDQEIQIGGMKFGVDRAVMISPEAGVSATFGIHSMDPIMGIYSSSDSLLDALRYRDADRIGLSVPIQPGQRLLVFRWDYAVSGSVSGTHPIGGVGSVRLGVQGAQGSSFSVICRVNKDEGARDAVTRTLKSLRLPRLIDSADDLVEGVVTIAEIEGSIAASVAATIGYDFNFLREVKGGGLQGDIGLKVVAGLQATVGFETSGRYLLAVERTGAATVRMQLFKLSHHGWNFGMNFSARVQGTVGVLPGQADDLVSAIFGTHALQVMKELEKWTDPNVPLSKLVVGLTEEHAAELINKAGVEVAELIKRLGAWRNLTGRIQAVLWKVIDGIDKTQKNDLLNILEALATDDEEARRAIIVSLLERADLLDSPIGAILEAAAEHGLLSLLDSIDVVGDLAQSILTIFDGDVLVNLKSYIEKALDLMAMLENPDPAGISDWLMGRLAAFLDSDLVAGRLNDEKLNELRKAAHTILMKRQDIYAKIREALEREYTFDLAVRIEKSTGKTALIDATFDTSKPEAVEALRQAFRKANYDAVLLGAPGISANKAELSHGIKRTSLIEVQFPFYNTSKSSLTEAMAKVRAAEDCGRVLFYEVEASDTNIVKNRMVGQLWCSMAFSVRPGPGVRLGGSPKAALGYRRSLVAENATISDLQTLLGPFVDHYLFGKFGGASSSFETWLATVDDEVESVVGNGPNEFGDVLLSQEVTLPGAALLAWFEPRSKQRLREESNMISRRLQRTFSRALHDSYFSDISKYENYNTAWPLLAWCAIQPSTSVKIVNGKPVEDGKEVIWDVFDESLISTMLRQDSTIIALSELVANARRRLLACGRNKTANFYGPDAVAKCLAEAESKSGKILFRSLMGAEADMITAFENSLAKASEAATTTGTNPAAAIGALAEATASLMRTFHARLRSVFETPALRSMSGLMLFEASTVLDPALTDTNPSAMLSLTVLKEERNYEHVKYLTGELPPVAEIALSERLVAG